MCMFDELYHKIFHVEPPVIINYHAQNNKSRQPESLFSQTFWAEEMKKEI